MTSMLMTILLGLIVLVLNPIISYWNARTIGPLWSQRHRLPWVIWALIWSGFIQSAIGFSQVIIAVGVIITKLLWPEFPEPAMKFALSLWYITIIIPALGTGLLITLHSVAEAWRTRSTLDILGATWNVGAVANNITSAASSMGEAASVAGEGLATLLTPSGDDKPETLVVRIGLLVAFVIVAAALLGGVMITRRIVDKYAHASDEALVAA